MKKTLLIAALALGLRLAAPAEVGGRTWFAPAHEGRSYVNQNLSLDRVCKPHPKAAWNGQMVLWEGEVAQQRKVGATTYVQLRSGNRMIPVTCPAAVYTLNVDRTGYQVAVKGEVQLKGGKFAGLVGRSFILLSPKKPWSRGSELDVSLVKQKATPMAGFLAWWVQCHHPDYRGDQCAKIGVGLVREAEKNGLDPLFFASLVQIESAFRVDAVSCTGALGLGQLMPGTASGLGVDPNDPDDNLAGAAKMLAGLLQDFSTSSEPRALALASYNAGPNLVRELGSVPAIPQTSNYVYFIGYLHHHMQQLARAQGVALTAAQ